MDNEMNKTKQFKSDSGNHYLDIITVLGTIVAIMILKKVISKYIK